MNNPLSIFSHFFFVQEIKKSEERNIVLDCDFDKIEMILSQASSINIIMIIIVMIIMIIIVIII